MSKTVSVSEAKAKLSAMMEWTVKNGDEVIIENRGRPTAVLLPYAEYEQYRETRKQAQRQAALERLRQASIEVQSRNQDLTPEEAEALAEEATTGAIANLVESDQIRFEE